MNVFRDITTHRDLLRALIPKDIRVRYKHSVMGFFWALLMPILIVLSGLVVREGYSIWAGRKLQMTDLLSVMIKSVPWAFFVAALRFSTNSLVGNANLVTKIYFPREIFPIASVIANLFDSSIAAAVVTLVAVICGVGASVQLLWLPLIVVAILTLTAGLGLVLSCANLFFRDIKYLVEVALTFGIFFTPVFYEARSFGKWGPVLLLNPLGSLLEGLNDVVVLHRSPNPGWVLYGCAFAAFSLIIGARIFDKAEPLFAERI